VSGVDDLRFDPPPECSTCDGLGVVPATGRGSDGWDPCPTCPHCNDEGVVCTHDGDIIGPCDCTSDELFTEARQLLDAATPGPWTHPSPTANWFTTPQPIQIDEADWGQETQEGGAMCGYRIGTLADERAWRYADVELIAAAPRLIAALLERAVTAEARSSCPGLSVRQQAEMLAVRCTAEQLVILRDLWADEMDRRKGGQDDR